MASAANAIAMVVATLALQGAMQVGIGLSFAFVAQAVRRRAPTGAGATLAQRAFLAWWYGLGSYIALLGVGALFAAFGLATYEFFVAVRIVNIPLLGLALWGMLTYVIYMWRGDPPMWRSTALYAAGLVVAYYAVTFLNTDGIVIGDFEAGLRDVEPLYMNLVYAYFALPLLAGIVAYGLLVRRIQGAEQRYRIRMVATSLLLWVGSGLAGEVSGNRALAFVTVSAFGLATCAVLALAYRPPAAIRAWLQERDERRSFSPEDALQERAALAAWGPERPS